MVVRDKRYGHHFRDYLSGLSAVGFGIQIGQINLHKGIFSYFHNNDVRIIFLTRSNYLAHLLASSSLGKPGEVHPSRKVTEKELRKASDYLHGLKEYETVASETCTTSMRVYYETYTTNYTSFIEIYRFLGVTTSFSSMEYPNGTVVLSYNDPRTGETHSDSVAFDTLTKHHTDLTVHYINNEEDVRNYFTYHCPEDMCMMYNNCTRKQHTILSVNETCASDSKPESSLYI